MNPALTGRTIFWLTLAAALGVAARVPSIRKRLLPRRTERRNASRILTEDALKQVHESEYRGYPATLQSLAGALSIRADRATSLVAAMEADGLIHLDGEAIRPTEVGREYARRVLRAHRLWERHLADETGVSHAAWHQEAERQEHALTPAQTDALAARLGHPRYDPHGDPIPTASGVVPSPGAVVPLNAMPPGRPARVVHVEDEPLAVYTKVSEAGLFAGQELMVIEATRERVRFLVEGEERALAPVHAANVGVEEVPTGERFDAGVPTERLSRLEPGESAEVLALSRACRGLERRRLMDLGILPGTSIEAVLRSPSGDPTAYRVRGATIALRREQADLIRVRRPATSSTS